MNIAKNIINKLGGAKKVATFLDVRVETVYQWTYDEEGLIPSKHVNPLMDFAKQCKVKLKYDDFFKAPSGV